MKDKYGLEDNNGRFDINESLNSKPAKKLRESAGMLGHTRSCCCQVDFFWTEDFDENLFEDAIDEALKEQPDCDWTGYMDFENMDEQYDGYDTHGLNHATALVFDVFNDGDFDPDKMEKYIDQAINEMGAEWDGGIYAEDNTGAYDVRNESLNKKPANTKINIRESLNKYDLRTDNKYDLRNLYDACIMTDKEKRTLAEMISKNTRANVLYEALMRKFEGKPLMEARQPREGFLKKYNGYQISYHSGRYVISNKNGLTVGESNSLIGAEARIDERDLDDPLLKNESLKEGKERKTKKFDSLEKAKKFKNSLPKEAEAKMDSFDTEKKDGSVKEWWEVYYFDTGKAKEESLKEARGRGKYFAVVYSDGKKDDILDKLKTDSEEELRSFLWEYANQRTPYIEIKNLETGSTLVMDDKFYSEYADFEGSDPHNNDPVPYVDGEDLDTFLDGSGFFTESLKEGVNDRLRQKAEPLANALDDLTDRDDGFYITYSIGMDDTGAVTGGVDFELFKSSRTEEEAKAEIERVFDENGFELDRRFKTNPGKTWFGDRTHYQIIEKGDYTPKLTRDDMNAG